jgi:phosphate transport system permease protein
MATDTLTGDITERSGDDTRETLVRLFFFACALISIATTLGIIALLVHEAMKFFSATAPMLGIEGQTATIGEFLTGTEWQPSGSDPKFGVVPLVSGTLIVTIGSAIIAMPLGVGTAMYLSEYASPEARSVLKPALEILAGVPTVVYGVFAVVYITPFLGIFFSSISFFNAASASIVVGIMIIPMVASISEDAMAAVPDELREAGYGMGATKFEVTTGVVLPAAASGIFSSFILGLSRAIGETMAVVLAMGGLANLYDLTDPGSFLESGMTMTVAMVQLLTGDITGGGLAYRSLFAIGLLLFVITLAMNVVSDLVSRRYREEYD